MPYYAVAFQEESGFWHRPATPEEVQKWKDEHPGEEPNGDLVVRTGHWSGSYPKVIGPFRKPKQAWRCIEKVQSRSMRADYPFVFKYGENQSTSQLSGKIEREEYVLTAEWEGRHVIHKIRFKKPRY